MAHEEFLNLYDNSLKHGWVSSKDPQKAKEQKQREKEYNAEYYNKHSNLWKKHRGVSALSRGAEVTVLTDDYINGRNMNNPDAVIGYAVPQTRRRGNETSSELASRGQIESAARRRTTNQSMKFYNNNRSTINKIVDRADIAVEQVRRNINNLSSRASRFINNLLK